MYVKIKNNLVAQFPYNPRNLAKENPNTSFPAQPSDELLESYGVYPVVTESAPSHDPMTQTVVKSTTPTLVGDAWTVTYSVVQLTDEQIANNLQSASDNIREKRNAKLAETDWWAVSDRTMSAEEAAYRQALRNITEQEGFPYNVTFPEKPEAD